MIERRIRTKEIERIGKQLAIIDYTNSMGAGDGGSYSFVRKSLKWRRIFFWLLEVVIVNGYILYSIQRQQDGLRKKTHLKCRKKNVYYNNLLEILAIPEVLEKADRLPNTLRNA